MQILALPSAGPLPAGSKKFQELNTERKAPQIKETSRAHFIWHDAPRLVERCRLASRWRGDVTNESLRNPIFFEYFPYVCPEPVLVKSSFQYTNGTKMGFLTWSATPVARSSAMVRSDGIGVSKHSVRKHISLFECFPELGPEPVLVN
jgi:hypothetical protein